MMRTSSLAVAVSARGAMLKSMMACLAMEERMSISITAPLSSVSSSKVASVFNGGAKVSNDKFAIKEQQRRLAT